ncbi:fumarylacetoacetate hydrolase family protein [Solilutibacter tolerans]|uniref:2-keto-4-pentenoate hydratase/2-oxohepta-3-ene-1,7-dioic acid hydratase (Catechol pathway) n=1 Tax=Solilutibacter tolerans TaxID=1604334 RepID=A0A1N6UA76_9GAMM|nr:fumarylacetoacetate hydrolase family protein [Lysobacter tolerans]SIQ62512.1 2-keto-4-pentenoate hydratase/2-oxohepta-3-ene-1,7-dioic acid hydratase (catechol pathway) [Lysobacter tolerans]
MTDIVPAHAPVCLDVQGAADLGDAAFPIRRIYCVGRNFADHAREMGAEVAASKAERGTPVFFLKPADAVVTDGVVPYPPGTEDLHHEVELIVALGTDAPSGILDRVSAESLVLGYGIGLDLTRRDLQAIAKSKGLPWDTGKSFDACAVASPLLLTSELPDIDTLGLSLQVNGELRQQGRFVDWVWDVPDILIELSRLYSLKAGDLIYMGTPAGVAALHPGDHFIAALDGTDLRLQGTVVDRRSNR